MTVSAELPGSPPSAEAAAGTPAAGAWAAFVSDLTSIARQSKEGVEALHGALATAAQDYAEADATIAKGIRGQAR